MRNNVKILYTTKNVYGNETNYPASDDAKFICALTGRKTLTNRDLEIAKAHGHEAEKVAL